MTDNPSAPAPKRRVETIGAVLLALMVTTAGAFFDGALSLGILLGGLISLGNYAWLKRDLRRMLERSGRWGKAGVQFRFVLRLTAAAVVLYFVMTSGTVDFIGLLTGLSIIVCSLILDGILAYRNNNHP